MSGRRNRNGIRGPQSALTDFLATHNISAQQIRQDFEARRQAAEAAATAEAATTTEPSAVATSEAATPGDESETVQEREVTATSTKKRKRVEIEITETIKKKVGAKKSKKKKDDDDFEDTDDDWGRVISKKARPAPGQFANCEICGKRFTVTPYIVQGPEGGLLCPPCGKQVKKDQEKNGPPAAKPAGRKRRKQESDKLDGLVGRGAKSLSQMCIEKVVQNHDAVDELGDLPQNLLGQLSAIFSKRRVLKPDTLPLFVRPDLNEITLHDAAYLEVKDYKRVFAEVPGVKKLALGNTCQFKDEVVQYMAERCTQLKSISLYAPNLVTDPAWRAYFKTAGPQLETVALKWLDASFDDETVRCMIKSCPNLQRLKLKFCRNLTETGIEHISQAKTLQHLSLQTNQPITAEGTTALIEKLGANLQTLSLEKFLDADDSALTAIHNTCRKLKKLRFSENDMITDKAFADLFTAWKNPPLQFIDVSCTRDMDNNNPDGPEDTVGIGSAAFKAVMAHSGQNIKHLDVASCRHISLGAFLDVFNGDAEYPNLEHINISFCNVIDTSVIAGIFKSCPALKKLIAFGCFDVGDVVVPRNIVLIGIPKAQDAVEQFGVGIDIDEALGRMVEVDA